MKKLLFVFTLMFNFFLFYAQEKDITLSLDNELRTSISYLKASPEYKTKDIKRLSEKDSIYILGVFGDYLAVKNDTLFGYLNKSKLKTGDSLCSLFENKDYRFAKPEIENKCHFYKKEIDEFTGKSVTITENYNLSKVKPFYYGDVHLQLSKYNSNKYLRISINRDLGCVVSFEGSKSWVKFKLENNQIVSFYHNGKTDCGDFSIYAKITSNDIKKLKTSPIKSIRFQGDRYYHDEKNIVWNTFFIDKLDCIN